MNAEIIMALVLWLAHAWLIPFVFSIKHAQWMLGARDDVVELSVQALRAKRAAANYAESLPAFLALAIVAKIDGVDLSELAMYWLILRVLFLVLYVLGTPFIRSLVWTGSLVVLVMMAMALWV